MWFRAEKERYERSQLFKEPNLAVHDVVIRNSRTEEGE